MYFDAGTAIAPALLSVGGFVSFYEDDEGYWHCGKVIEITENGIYVITKDDHSTHYVESVSKIRGMDAFQSHNLAEVEKALLAQDFESSYA